MTALVRPISAVAFELRTAWATQRRVALSLSARCDHGRVEGHVSQVAPTGAYIRVAGLHVPIADVLAVHFPSLLGDSTRSMDDRPRRARQLDDPCGTIRMGAS